MRKLFIALIAVIVMASFTFAFVGCGTEQPDGERNEYDVREGYYTVIFDTDGGNFDPKGDSAPMRLYVKEGEKVQRPNNDPVKSDGRAMYEFLGWYVDGVEYDFDSEIMQDLTIKAQWKLEGIYGSDLPIIK